MTAKFRAPLHGIHPLPQSWIRWEYKEGGHFGTILRKAARMAFQLRSLQFMVNGKEAFVDEFVLHRIAAREEACVFSDFSAVIKGEEEQQFLRKLFLRPFTNMAFTCAFDMEGGPKSNVLQGLCAKLHKGADIVECSVAIAKHVIAAGGEDMPEGDLIAARFSEVEVGGAVYDAVGIFKFDEKEVFLESKRKDGGIALRLKRGLGNGKPNKACLVVYMDKDATLFIIDNEGSTAWWQKDVIRSRPKKDHVNSTTDVMQLTKTFITQQLPEDFVVEKTDQIDLLNRSVQYFKEHTQFDRQEFAEEVFQDEKAIRSFNQYSDRYQEEHNVELGSSFEISPDAVKKQARVFKSVLKLDKNFHVYIHGDRSKIERGQDDHGKFYKIYYEQEN
ncbi:MAG: hypothetical protein J5I62_05800 [Flavobacteriales bacterium]|nr:hypothetical protein [Flavobacteriales bacterium]MEB2342225.1 nucleoid-associated protein [Flavobacteriia bacterium]